MRLDLEPCQPPLWAQTGHQQTILAHLIASPRLKTKGKEFRVTLPDQDVLVGEFYEGTSHFVILLFHGLTGSTQSDYMQRTALLALEQGHSVLLMNHRGCGTGRGLAKAPYHSGRGDDLSAVVQKVREQFPELKQIAVGFSLSANALLLLLSGAKGDSLPDAAIAVNGPVDLQATSSLIKRGWNRIYDFMFVQECREDIEFRKQTQLLTENIKIPFWSYLDQVDDLYTAPQSGFKNKEDYYAKCSTYNRLQMIKTPTVIITSKDDPFIPWQPYMGAVANPYTYLHIENHGGHMGYLSKKTPYKNSQRWLDYALDQSLKQFTTQLNF